MKQLAVSVDKSSARARGACGHIITEKEPYFIIVQKNVMYAVCSACKRAKYEDAHLCMKLKIKQVSYLTIEKNRLLLKGLSV